MSFPPDHSTSPPRRPGAAARLAAPVFAFTVAGYPVAGLLAAALDLPSVATSIPFRALVIGLSLALALITMSRWRIRWPTLLVLALWSAYLLRLIWDARATDLPGADTSMIFFVAVVVVPCVALIAGTRSWNDGLTSIWVLATGGVVTLGALTLDGLQLIEGRSLTEATSRLSTDTVNPITLGHVAVSALLAAYCLLGSWKLPSRRLLLAGVSAVSAMCLIATGSKGPIVSLAAAVLFLFVIGRARPLLLAALACVSGAALLLSNTSIAERIMALAEDESTAVRIQLADDAFRQMASFPLVGSAFLELNTQTYPHNLIIESMMALGIPLGLLFMALCAYGLWRAFRLGRVSRPFLALMFVQYSVAGLLSGSLYGSAAFWAALTLLVNTPMRAPARVPSATPPAISGERDVAPAGQ